MAPSVDLRNFCPERLVSSERCPAIRPRAVLEGMAFAAKT
jgi:hypothetical protein